MYTFIPASSERFDELISESYARCNSVFTIISLNDLITESKNESEKSNSKIEKVFDSIISFFKTVIKTVMAFGKKIGDKFSNSKSKVSLVAKLKTIKKEIKTLKKAGVTTFEFYDVHEYDKVMKAFYKASFTLMQEWEQKVQSGKSTAAQAELFIRDSDSMIKKATDKISAIKSKKINMPIEDVVKWIDRQIGTNKDSAINISVKDYTDRLYQMIEFSDKLKRDLNDYAERTGYIPMAKSAKDIVHNCTLFLKKNWDWCAAYAASGILAIYGVLREAKSLDDSAKEVTAGGADSVDELENQQKNAGSLLFKRQAEQRLNATMANQRNSNDEKYVNARTANKRAFAASTILAGVGTGRLMQKKMNGSDSIYNKK